MHERGYRDITTAVKFEYFASGRVIRCSSR